MNSSFSLQFPPEICQIVGLEPGWPSAVATDRNSCTQHSSTFWCIIPDFFFLILKIQKIHEKFWIFSSDGRSKKIAMFEKYLEVRLSCQVVIGGMWEESSWFLSTQAVPSCSKLSSVRPQLWTSRQRVSSVIAMLSSTWFSLTPSSSSASSSLFKVSESRLRMSPGSNWRLLFRRRNSWLWCSVSRF